ncbi:hypothetical protein [Actinomadura kijaniata]|uniref:hypothetical protein n=1 Tax=Actinomadura kijaniata TaxID=46161 RepID=UPI00082B6062|nr:hypothetical protein [Actinomadura kijaniata]
MEAILAACAVVAVLGGLMALYSLLVRRDADRARREWPAWLADLGPRVPPHTRRRALVFALEGKMIHAVKAVREDTGLPLKDAKRYVDALLQQQKESAPHVLAGEAPPEHRAPGAPLSERVRAFKAAEDHASAVALVRAETGMTRAEAERFVAALD